MNDSNSNTSGCNGSENNHHMKNNQDFLSFNNNSPVSNFKPRNYSSPVHNNSRRNWNRSHSSNSYPHSNSNKKFLNRVNNSYSPRQHSYSPRQNSYSPRQNSYSPRQHSYSPRQHSYSEETLGTSYDKKHDTTAFLHPSFTENPWRALEEEWKRNQSSPTS